jgi:HSP20 family protein
MTVIRWDPYRELNAVHDRLNRMFGVAYAHRDADSVGTWMPAADIHENDKHDVIITAELPGVGREHLELHVENDTLTIRGERTPPTDVKDEQYHRMERAYGRFSRSFTLPSTADAQHATAEYRDGVLTVVVPRREEARPRQIEVKVA